MKQSISNRNVAMDVIRCVALLGVHSIHYFFHTDYYGLLQVGSRLYLFMLIRAASMTCVPLFLMLSGYLMKNKKPSRQYYSKLIRIVSLYILASLCCYLYQTRFTGNVFSFILRTLNYTASGYAWYMNMYFGLFLLIPFLNILYNGLPDLRCKHLLILTLLVMTAFTGIINCFCYFPETGWQLSGEVSQYQTILPDWWQDIYPLTYYFLGAYLKDHPLKLSKKCNLLLLLLAMFGNGTLNYVINYGQEFMHGAWQNWGSVLNVIQSVLLFNLLAGMEFKALSGKAAGLLSRVSELSLSAFLVSWMFDDLFYSMLRQFQPVPVYRLNWYPVTTMLVFVCSLLLAWILEKIYSLAAGSVSTLLCRSR